MVRANIAKPRASPRNELRLSHESPEFIEIVARSPSRQPHRAPQGPGLCNQQAPAPLQGSAGLGFGWLSFGRPLFHASLSRGIFATGRSPFTLNVMSLRFATAAAMLAVLTSAAVLAEPVQAAEPGKWI